MSFRVSVDPDVTTLSASKIVSADSFQSGNTRNTQVSGVPLSIDSQGVMGVTPTVSSTFSVGLNPAGMAITSDGKTLFVANNNNFVATGADNVTVINLETGVPSTINDSSFNQPYTITINPGQTIAYVTNSNSTTITMIDIDTNTVLGTITGFDGPSGMEIKGTTKAYVNNYGGPEGVSSGNGSTISIVNLSTNTISGTIQLSPHNYPDPGNNAAPAALALSPDQTRLYVANYVDGNNGTGQVAVINTVTDTVLSYISGFSGPFAIKVSPDGNKIYVTNFGSNNFYPFGTTVSVISVSSLTVTSTISVGIQPAGLAITPDSKYVYYNTLYTAYVNETPAVTIYVLTPGQGTVNIIDTETDEVISPTVSVGQSPANIVISPDGKYAYVTNYTSGTVCVIPIL